MTILDLGFGLRRRSISILVGLVKLHTDLNTSLYVCTLYSKYLLYEQNAKLLLSAYVPWHMLTLTAAKKQIRTIRTIASGENKCYLRMHSRKWQKNPENTRICFRAML